jgi:steroid delta-isomerase-like uncharacterized protein
MSEQNKATARRFFEEVISQGAVDAIDEVFAADYQDHDPANEEDTRGADGMRQEVSMYRSAFPDLQFTIEDQLAEGDEVATRWSSRGTHQGELMGIPPTGNQVMTQGITIFRFAEGKIQEGWWNWDALGLMRQVGAIPAEQPA